MHVKSTFAYALALITGLAGIAMWAQAPGWTQAQRRNSYLRGPAEKELIYVALPGTLEGSPG
jgi:hypothetical protein